MVKPEDYLLDKVSGSRNAINMNRVEHESSFQDPGIGVPEMWAGLAWLEPEPEITVSVVEIVHKVVGLPESL
jgi:hypothetical protein